MNRQSSLSWSSRVVVSTLLFCGGVAACSGASAGSGFPDDGTGSGGDAGTSTGGGTGNTGAGNPNGGGTLGNGGSTTTNPGGADAACAGESAKAQQQPLDIYIMLDQSGSMDEATGTGATKWEAVSSALNAFVQQPSAAGIGVGIQYFGLPGTGGSDSCTSGDYATPEVEIAQLPGVASAITASIASHSPTTATPTSAALQGAVDHAASWASAHQGHVTIALLATDGNPTECVTSISKISAIAAQAAAGNPKVPTFVIGVGSSLGNLNAIAAAGGTGQAFIVDTAGNVNQQFLDALNKIRGAALGCTYKIPTPTSGQVDYGSVNVQYTPGGATAPVTIPKVSDKSKCVAGADAWYYDNNASPTQIILCADSCTKIANDAKAAISVVSGCTSVVR